MTDIIADDLYVFDWQKALTHWSSDEVLVKELARYIAVYGEPGLSESWLTAKSLEELRRPVHTLRGVSALFGFSELNEYCEKLEERIVADHADDSVEKFVDEFSHLNLLISKTLTAAESALIEHF